MAEVGNFRTVLRGFHKQDVLEYIDSIRKETMVSEEQLNELNERREQCEQQATELETLRQALADKQAEVDQLQATVTELNDQMGNINVVRAEASRAKEEAEQLRNRMTAADESSGRRLQAVEEDKRVLAQRVVELEIELRDTKSEVATVKENAESALADSERYAALVGNVGTFLMEIRSMGQGYLEAAQKRGTDSIQQMEQAVSSLQEHLAACREVVETARRELQEQDGVAEQRIAALAEEMESAIPASVEEADTDSDSDWENERYFL